MKMKKSLLAAISGLALLGTALDAASDSNFGPKNLSSEIIQAPLNHYPVGEKLVYKVNWWGIPIGTGEVELTESKIGGGSYHIEAVAKDNEYLASFYPVKDTLSSTMAAEGHSLAFEKELEEGKYRANEIISFDYNKKIAGYESKTNGSKKEVEIFGPVHDVLTAFYWIRKQPMTVGENLATKVFSDEKTWDFLVKVKEVKDFSLPGQKSQRVVVLIPDAKFKGVLVDRGKVWIYATADERRIPLLIRLNTPYGPVTAVLANEP
jgi:hypothetical protein